jgi:hypothetical protein
LHVNEGYSSGGKSPALAGGYSRSAIIREHRDSFPFQIQCPGPEVDNAMMMVENFSTE